jgi:type I restriction enzyme, S subunit
MENEATTPPLRFPEFQDSWCDGHVGDLGKVITGTTPPTENAEYYGGKSLFVAPGDIRDQRFVNSTANTLSELGFSKGRLIRKGSTLFVCIGGSIGKLGQAGVDCVTNQQINAVVPDANDDDFVYSLLERHARYIRVLSAQQAVPILNKSEFSSFPVFVPSIHEQQKIAAFLLAVDKRIEQLAWKKELLLKYKNGVMQQIFSQKIRFKDDSGNDFPGWEEKRGKDLFRSHSNKGHDATLPILAATQESGMVPRDGIGIRILSSDESIKAYKVVEPGDFVISLRSFQGGIEYSNYLGICSPAYTILKPKIPINDDFFKFYFKKDDFITRLSLTVVGIRDGKQITYDAFGGLKLKIPSVPEQAKIAGFLTYVDAKIESIGQQIEKTKTFKKGLLHQLFV